MMLNNLANLPHLLFLSPKWLQGLYIRPGNLTLITVRLVNDCRNSHPRNCPCRLMAVLGKNS